MRGVNGTVIGELYVVWDPEAFCCCCEKGERGVELGRVAMNSYEYSQHLNTVNATRRRPFPRYIVCFFSSCIKEKKINKLIDITVNGMSNDSFCIYAFFFLEMTPFAYRHFFFGGRVCMYLFFLGGVCFCTVVYYVARLLQEFLCFHCCR